MPSPVRRLFVLFALAAVAGGARADPWWPRGRMLQEYGFAVTSSDRAIAAANRVRPALERDLAAAGLRFGAPAFVRIFKQERELELWLARDDGTFALFRTFPICTYSGALGPKTRQGDGQ
ncbi:MAG TPA: hypothetical protein VFL14_13090, partial [Xanthomonadales bacterium]|nr:hypothetical protein [Xanthomonadales bacterium]